MNGKLECACFGYSLLWLYCVPVSSHQIHFLFHVKGEKKALMVISWIWLVSFAPLVSDRMYWMNATKEIKKAKKKDSTDNINTNVYDLYKTKWTEERVKCDVRRMESGWKLFIKDSVSLFSHIALNSVFKCFEWIKFYVHHLCTARAQSTKHKKK